MDDRWIPVHDAGLQDIAPLAEILYAVLGPDLSQTLVKIVAESKVPGADVLRQATEVLDDLVGKAPKQLLYMGTAVASVRIAQEHLRGAKEEGPHDEVVRRLGSESEKFFGWGYMGMFARFGFDSDTLTHYMKHCTSAFEADWPPPGAAYRREIKD